MVDFTRDNKTYMCCGKVHLKKDMKRLTGYVIDEDESNFIISTSSNEMITVVKPAIIVEKNDKGKTISVEYDYTVCEKANPSYYIFLFEPVRFKFNRNAINNCVVMMNKVVFDSNNKVIEMMST